MGSIDSMSIISTEIALCEQFACNEAILVSSGLSALEIVLIGIGAGPGIIVACDALYPFAAMAVINVGARPVAYDLEPETGLPLWESVVQCRAAGATILVVTSYFGQRAACPDLAARASAIGLLLIEDRAQCFGRHSECWPAIFSFQAGKFLSCGFGGAIALPREACADVYRRQVHLGWWPRAEDEGISWSSGWMQRVPGRSARIPPAAAEILAGQILCIDVFTKSLAASLNDLRAEVELAVGADAVVPEAEGVRLVAVRVGNARAKASLGRVLSARGVTWGCPVHPLVTEWPGLTQHWLEQGASLSGTRIILSSLILVSLDTWNRHL